MVEWHYSKWHKIIPRFGSRVGRKFGSRAGRRFNSRVDSRLSSSLDQDLCNRRLSNSLRNMLGKNQSVVP